MACLFSVFVSSNSRRERAIHGLPCGRFRPTAVLRHLSLTGVLARTRSIRRREFCFSGLPARRVLISLGLTGRFRIGLGFCDGVRLHSPKCIDHVPTLRFRVERRPRGPEGLRLPDLSIRFETFPAVYRAPSLFWHRLVMNSQSFPDSPYPGGLDEFVFPFFGFTG